MSITFTGVFETARDYAEHGLPVFPTHTVVDGRCSCGKEDCVRDRGKHPRTPNGFKDATTDERRLLAWNERWPDANWALACGAHMSVIDIDSKHGADPAEVLPDYELEARPIVWTGEAGEDTSLPGVRGAHVYCAPGTRTGKAAAAGVEIRASGAYVMLPGSRHVSGVTYEWRDGVRPWDVDLLSVPKNLVPDPVAKQAAVLRDPDVRVPHGERHTHLKDFAVRLVRAGVTSERVILAHLYTHFEQTCDPEPPLEVGELEKIAAWATNSDIAERERQRDRSTQDAKVELGKASTKLGLHKKDPLVHVWRETAGGATPLTARTASDIWLRWERQRDMLKPDDLLYPVLAIPGMPGPEKLPLTKAKAAEIYKHLVNAAETFGSIDMRDETYEWLDGFERVAVAIEGSLSDPASKFLTIRDLQTYRPQPDDDGAAVERWQAPLLLTDRDNGDRYVGVQDLGDHLRKERRITVAWETLAARMSEIGWVRCELQAWDPEVSRAEGQKVRATVYRWRPEGGR